MNTVPAAPDKRREELAKIHLGAARIGLLRKDDDSAYRDMLFTIARVRSARDLDEFGRRQVLDHLRSRGAFRAKKRGASSAWRPVPAPFKVRLIGKIRAMLAVRRRPDEYADAMARRMFRVERYEWCTPEQLRKIVAALEYDARRKLTHSERMRLRCDAGQGLPAAPEAK